MIRHRGGITFWRVGRLSGSVCLQRKPVAELWRNAAPYRLSHIIMAATFGFMAACWLIIGINSGFIL